MVDVSAPNRVGLPPSQVYGAQDQRGGSANTPSKSSSVYDVFPHHNQALDVWKRAQNDGMIKKGAIIIHVDSHSDLFTSGENCDDIGNFLNKAIINGTASEIYWVIPDFFRGRTSEPSGDPNTWLLSSSGILSADAPREFNVYVMDSKILFYKPADHVGHPNAYKVVKFHKVFADELPDLANEKRDVLLDIDADYFSLEDKEAIGASYIPPRAELISNIGRFSDILSGKNITPKVSTLARSPRYTNYGHIRIIEEEFRKWFGGKEYVPDSYSAYEHKHTNPAEFDHIAAIRNDFEKGREVDGKDMEWLHIFGYGDLENDIFQFQAGQTGQKHKQAILDKFISIIGPDYVPSETRAIRALIESGQLDKTLKGLKVEERK